MADTAVAITAGTGTNIDTRTESTNSNHRQVIVIGDPTANASVAAVMAASTAPVATDPALVVSLSPNGSGVGVLQASTTSGQLAAPIAGAAQSAEATAVANGQTAKFVTDLVGKLITLPYANPENFLSGTSAALTDTTSTQIIAAQAAGVRIYVTDMLVTNSHATVSTFVTIRDGNGGTILWEGYAAAVGGGFAKSLLVPIKTTAATRLDVKCETTGANVIVSVSGYKGI